MIKRINKIKIKYIILGLLVFLIGAISQINLFIPLFLISLFIYLKARGTNLKNCNLLNISLLFLIIFVSGYFIIRCGWPIFFIPFSVIPMLTALLYNNLELSLIITLATSVSVASISSNPLVLLSLFLISGTLSSIFVQNVRRPIMIVRAGFITGIVQVIALIFIEHFKFAASIRYSILMLNGIVSGIIVTGILPIFEYLFRTVTNISLLELFDHPLLQQLKLKAIGTYHHSLVVGNLSEAACEAVGANALLARLGAYYHDIGKLEKAEYFSENQEAMQSKHDTLSADMSKLIIMNHVKEGVDLAKKHKLNPILINFIQQHHGNSLVYYFYRRALENLEEEQDVKEEGFRYPGPKPDTKETAIVLLADSVEAATRALKDPMPAKIEEVVRKIINNKFIDGQLDDCELALKDLEKISAVFIRILSKVYYSRITYPESR